MFLNKALVCISMFANENGRKGGKKKKGMKGGKEKGGKKCITGINEIKIGGNVREM